MPTPPDQQTDVRSLIRVLRALRAHRGDAIGASVALVIGSAITLVAPQLIRLAVDRGIAERQGTIVLLAVAGLLGVAALSGVCSFVQGYLAERASQGVAYDLRDALFAHLEQLSFSYYDHVQTGQLVTRLTNDVEQIRTFAGTGIVELAAAVVMFAGTAILLGVMNLPLMAVVLVVVLPIVWLLTRFVQHIAPVFQHVQYTLGRLNTVLQEDLVGVRVVRAFTREDTEHDRYAAVNDTLLEYNVTTVRAISNNFPFVFLCANLGTVAVVWIGGTAIIRRQLSLGELLAFNSYLAFLVQPLLTVGFLAASLSRAGASARRVVDVLDAPVDVTDAPSAVPLTSLEGRLEFRDVYFRYPGTEHDVLRGVSFQVEPGETVALVGTTGSGKSSLALLIPRFYDVTSGSILVDGHDVRTVQVETLRRHIGVVMQDARLFSGTIRDNIAYGRPSASLDEIEAVARTAQAEPFIRAMPHAYETPVGERGVTLSGGQRQRIAIARALLINPRFLILDDSLSAVDTETELALQTALRQMRTTRQHTILLIAQRLSTVRDADRILVLDAGRIVEQGTHDELRRESALYNEILGAEIAHAEGRLTSPARANGSPPLHSLDSTPR